MALEQAVEREWAGFCDRFLGRPERVRHPAPRTWPMPVGDRQPAMVAPPVRAPRDSGRFDPAPALDQHGAAIRAEFLPA